jgi:serpin B
MMRAFRWATYGLLMCLVVVACGAPDAQTGTVPDETTEDESIPAQADPVVDRPEPESPHLDALVRGINDVGYDLFGVASEPDGGDMVLSPLSIGIAFGMADVGATGEPAAALADLFSLPAEGENRWAAFNALEQSVTDVGEPIVRLANRLFPDRGFPLTDGYDERLARWFGAGLEPLPLQAQPEPSRVRINDWIAEQTEDLIPELLPDGFLTPDSVLVLVNALYLEADWALTFGKYPTRDADFTRLDGSTVTVPLMHEQELSGPAVKTADYAATELPYEDGELSMLLIVPEQGRFIDVQSRLDADLVAEIDAAATTGFVEVLLPRFDTNASLDLRAAMEGGLGVEGLFDVPGWDGIGEGITLEQAVHAANIEVDEQGTVAAAATALEFGESGPPEPDVTVRADKPFLYLIRHVPTGAVLFIGRVLDPT